VATVIENTRYEYYEALAKEDANKKNLLLKKRQERRRRLLEKHRNNG